MMSSYQKIVIVGYVGAVPKLDVLQDGRRVASFSVAVGERSRRVIWFKVVAWRDLAEHVAVYLDKGSRVLVEGRISGEAYLDRSGLPACSLKVTATEVRFLSPVYQHQDRVPGFLSPVYQDEDRVLAEPSDGSDVSPV